MTLPKPYYQDDFVTLYHGDCLELLPHIDADVLVTDPPYGTGYYSTDGNSMLPALLAAWVDAYDAVAVFGYAERLAELCGGRRPEEWITWWPTNAACRGVNYNGLRREAEHVAVFGDAKGLYELRQPRSMASGRITAVGYDGANNRGDSHGEIDTRRFGDVWTDTAPGLGFQSHLRRHPNEKPMGLVSRLVEGLSSPAQTVLDPFAGSGTTLRAAKDLGRKSIGIEIEEKYCEIAARRCSQEVLDFGEAA